MSNYQFVDSTQLNSDLTSIANAIRTKGGTSSQLAFPSGFVSAIDAIPSGGGSDVWEAILDHELTLNLKDDTTFDSITPSTTAQQIFAAVNGVKDEHDTTIQTAAADFSTYSYIGIAIQTVDFAWLSEPANTGVPRMNFSINYLHPNLYLRDVYEMWSANKAACFQKNNDSFQNRNQGVMAGGCSFGTNSASTSTPKFTLQIGKINAQANSTNFPVSDMEKIDSANTNIKCVWKMYRSTRKDIDASMYNLVRSLLYGTV